MNTIIFQTIRSFAILGAIFFAFAGEVFAAPTLLPTSSLEITNTSAVVRGYVQNPGELAVVWFEWSESSSAATPTVVAMSNFFGDGFFAARLDGLTPGVTYSYRAVAKSGGATVYSPTASFRTLGGSPATATTTPSQGALGGASLVDTPSIGSTQTTSSQASSAPIQTQPVVVSQAKKSTPKAVVAKNSTSVTSSNNTNNNMASVIGAGNGVLPGTLIGWVALIVATLVVVLLMVMILESTERRKKMRVIKKTNGEEVLIEE